MGSILQNEVERVVKTKEDFIICEKSFVKSLELKLFFQACYDYHENRNVLFEFSKGLKWCLCDCFNKSFHR